MIATPALPPPAIEQPAPFQATYGLVTGRVPRGALGVIVRVNGRTAASRLLRGRRFSLRLHLPVGPATVRVTTWTGDGRTSSAVVRDVFVLSAASRPRLVAERNDPTLAGKVRALARRFGGTAGVYVCSLTGGSGAAWNARARFSAASTLKLAIATAVLGEYGGIPPPGSSINALLVAMLRDSDNAAANSLEIWLGGSTSGGSARIDALMRSLGMTDSEMYGGYLVEPLADRIPSRVEEQPGAIEGKYTTASDLARLYRAIWLASGGLGPLRRERPGFTAADGRHLLWLLSHVSDSPKLDRVEARNTDVAVLHKAGWIDSVRHDAGLVFWPGGVFVASVMTWSPYGPGWSADALAGRVATLALGRLRQREG